MSDDIRTAAEELAPDWDGLDVLLSSRAWLEAALTKHGGMVTGSGIGRDGADVSVVVDGVHYWITMRVSSVQQGGTA